MKKDMEGYRLAFVAPLNSGAASQKELFERREDVWDVRIVREGDMECMYVKYC